MSSDEEVEKIIFSDEETAKEAEEVKTEIQEESEEEDLSDQHGEGFVMMQGKFHP